MKMENAEEIFHFLEEFSKRKTKNIPQELNDYLAYVARTGDPVYQWSLVKSLFKEKLLNAITDFYETAPGIDIPPYPNVDPFNYDTMKNSLLERLDSFTAAPFTVQRICELLTCPRKQYNRVDKFMRAIEKNILVVSTREPGLQRHIESDNIEPMEPIVNGSDNNSECNVDVEMEDMSWKESIEQPQISEPQPGSSDAHISVEDLEARLKAKKDSPVDSKEKVDPQYESVTPPELNVSPEVQTPEIKTIVSDTNSDSISSVEEGPKIDSNTNILELNLETKTDVEMATEDTENHPLVVPEIKVDDAEMTEKKLNEQSTTAEQLQNKSADEETVTADIKTTSNTQPVDDSSSDSIKEDAEKLISEVSTSSEESSSSSDVTDGNSNSPKTDGAQIVDVQEETNQSDIPAEETAIQPADITAPSVNENKHENSTEVTIQSDNYSISDVNSELPQPSHEASNQNVEAMPEEKKEDEKQSTDVENDSKDKIPIEDETNNTESDLTTEVCET